MGIEELKEKCNGKKLLILAGASVHIKLVEAAKRLGVYTVVTDYLDDSPAKNIADKSWMINITDIVKLCEESRKCGIDGVISGWIDPCQRPYQELCEQLGVPCLYNKDQVVKMTDKHEFKKMCKENSVHVIPEYTIEQCINHDVEFPVFIKPVDSRGSRGQAVCRNYEQLMKAIDIAKSESSNGDVLIEKFMEDCHEFQVTYFVIDGHPYLIRTTDSYTGTLEQKLSNVVVCSVSPSVYTDTYLETTNNLVIEMFKRLGINNGPVFMQGFEKNGEFYFFDPGARFPGVDFELILKKVYGYDLMEAMVIYALTGVMPKMDISEDSVFIKNMRAAIMFPTIGAGEIKRIIGYDLFEKRADIISILSRAQERDKISWTYDVNQRLAEIDILSNNTDELIQLIQFIQNNLRVLDIDENNMIYGEFDVDRIK